MCRELIGFPEGVEDMLFFQQRSSERILIKSPFVEKGVHLEPWLCVMDNHHVILSFQEPHQTLSTRGAETLSQKVIKCESRSQQGMPWCSIERERKKTKTVSFLPLNEAHLILSPITPFLSPHDLNNRYNGQIPDSRKMSLKYKMADRWEISREQVWEGWVTVTESIYRVFNDSLGSLVKFCYSGTRHLRRALIFVPGCFYYCF